MTTNRAVAIAAPAEVPAARKLPEPREGVLVVCDTPDEAGRFTSLRAACFAAKNGDVIELCYDGERVERPLMLNNLKITVRAGDGYKPSVRFRPAEAAIPNLPHSMIAVVGGRLSFVIMEIGFDVPSPQELPADQWSLFTLQQADFLGLEQCVLTVRNASSEVKTYHPDVAVIAMSLPDGAKGESQDSSHKGDIDVIGWAWGMEARTAMGAGGASGKYVLRELKVTKLVDSASSSLMSIQRNNTQVSKVVLTIRKAGETGQEYFKITLSNARITTLDLGAEMDGSPLLTAQVSFAFQKINVEYKPQGDDGQLRGAMTFDTDVDLG